VKIAGASDSLSTSTFGVFTEASAGGVAIVTSGSANTITTASDATNNNMMTATTNNANTLSTDVAGAANVYFRVQNPQGSAATANVTIEIRLAP
jgi:hypothetical protein